MNTLLDKLALLVSLIAFVVLSPLMFFALMAGQRYEGLDAAHYRATGWNCDWKVKRRWLRLPINSIPVGPRNDEK